MVNRVKASSVQLNGALVQKKYEYLNIPSNLLITTTCEYNQILSDKILIWSLIQLFSCCLYFYEILIVWFSNDCFWILNFQWWIESLLKWIYQIGFQINVIPVLVIGSTLSYLFFRDIFCCQTLRLNFEFDGVGVDFVFTWRKIPRQPFDNTMATFRIYHGNPRNIPWQPFECTMGTRTHI